MKDFLKNNGLWILFAGAVIAVALALLSYFSTNTSPLVDLANTITSPFRAVCTSVAGWFVDKQNYYEDVTALKEENEALKQQIAEMEATVRQGAADSQENVFLRDLLDLRKQRRDLSDFETATVMERSVTNWTSSLTLDKGSVHGVEEGDCVIDGQGNLVGRISEVGYDWSTVLTVVDTDTSLGARVYRTQDIGIANGDFALMERGQLRLDSLPVSSLPNAYFVLKNTAVIFPVPSESSALYRAILAYSLNGDFLLITKARKAHTSPMCACATVTGAVRST